MAKSSRMILLHDRGDVKGNLILIASSNNTYKMMNAYEVI